MQSNAKPKQSQSNATQSEASNAKQSKAMQRMIWEARRRHPEGTQEAPRKHPGGTQEAPRRPQDTQEAPEASESNYCNTSKLKCKSCINMSILRCVFEGKITKYCKLQAKMLPGSGDGAKYQPRPLIQHHENPYR